MLSEEVFMNVLLMLLFHVYVLFIIFVSSVRELFSYTPSEVCKVNI